MRKRLFKTLVAVLAIAAAAAGPARAQNSSTSNLEFTEACGGSGTANDNVVWTVTSDGTESTFSSTKGIHYGTGTAQVQYIQLSTSGISGTITQVVVNASTASGVTATVGVTVGGNAFGGDAQSLTTSDENYTFTGSASGAIVVRVAKPSAATKALYVKYITVTYTPASSGGGSTPEQSETIITTSTTGQNIITGTHFIISSGYIDGDGMQAINGGITVTPVNTEYITQVVVTCGYRPEKVSDANISVSSGTKTITNNGATITVTNVNATTFTFTCSDPAPQFSQFEVYYLEPELYTVRFAAGNDGWSVQDVTASASATAPAILQNVMAGDSLVVTAPATLPGKVKSVKAVKFVAVQSIVLDKQTAFLAKDSTMTLSVASVLPENAADKSYTWSSDATGVASVNEIGVVTAVAAGTANIIATANDGSGVKDTCVVTVLNSVIIDGVTVLYASDNDRWSTITGYNPGVLYLDGDNVRLTSNNASLFYQGDPVHSIDFIYSPFDDYQWLRAVEISNNDFYYHQGETWADAISANRPFNHDWSIEGGHVKCLMQILVDTDSQPVDPTATIDPSTVDYNLDTLN